MGYDFECMLCRDEGRYGGCPKCGKEKELISNEKIKTAKYSDGRVLNIPKEEVCNNLIWRQLDATRNSIQMVGQANFPHKELQNKSCNMIQDMLMVQKDTNWNDLDTHLKRGSCCIQIDGVEDIFTDNARNYTRWEIDKEIPIFTQHREYIENRIYIVEE